MAGEIAIPRDGTGKAQTHVTRRRGHPKVKAELENGVLNLTLPKRPEAQPKKISVSSK